MVLFIRKLSKHWSWPSKSSNGWSCLAMSTRAQLGALMEAKFTMYDLAFLFFSTLRCSQGLLLEMNLLCFTVISLNSLFGVYASPSAWNTIPPLFLCLTIFPGYIKCFFKVTRIICTYFHCDSHHCSVETIYVYVSLPSTVTYLDYKAWMWILNIISPLISTLLSCVCFFRLSLLWLSWETCLLFSPRNSLLILSLCPFLGFWLCSLFIYILSWGNLFHPLCFNYYLQASLIVFIAY